MAKKDKELRYGLRIDVEGAIQSSPRVLCYFQVVRAAHKLKELTSLEIKGGVRNDLASLLWSARKESRNGYLSLNEKERGEVVEKRIKEVGEMLNEDNELSPLDDARIYIDAVNRINKLYGKNFRRIYGKMHEAA